MRSFASRFRLRYARAFLAKLKRSTNWSFSPQWLNLVHSEAIAPNHAEHLEAKTLVQSRDHTRICQFLLQSGVVTDAEAELVASDEEITQAILKDDYNPVTAAYLLFAEKLERTKGSRRSTRTTPRSTHISPNPSQPPSPRLKEHFFNPFGENDQIVARYIFTKNG